MTDHSWAIFNVGIALCNLACTLSVVRAMARLRASRHQLESALAETTHLRALAIQAAAKGPY